VAGQESSQVCAFIMLASQHLNSVQAHIDEHMFTLVAWLARIAVFSSAEHRKKNHLNYYSLDFHIFLNHLANTTPPVQQFPDEHPVLCSNSSSLNLLTVQRIGDASSGS
jgi:hypothetical protein